MGTKAAVAPNVERETSEESETCSRCDGPLDTTSYPKWCKKCRAANQREYSRTLKDMSETRGFAAGVSAAKAFVATEFDTAIRGASITGHEAARLVRACKGPALPVS